MIYLLVIAGVVAAIVLYRLSRKSDLKNQQRYVWLLEDSMEVYGPSAKATAEELVQAKAKLDRMQGKKEHRPVPMLRRAHP